MAFARARSLLCGLLALAPAVAARADGAGEVHTLAVVPAESTLRYFLEHKFHKMTATARGPEGKVVIGPDGRTQLMVRARVETFDSGNSNRNAHALEVVEGHRFPLVELRGLADQVTLPAAPGAVDRSIKAQLTFHGVSEVVDIPVKLQALPDGRYRATAAFSISLDRFKIDRPSLLGVKVEDALKIEADLVLAR